ncbi:MAG: ABC transporter ATP-binding protein [Alphaproteobacteria bacterium]
MSYVLLFREMWAYAAGLRWRIVFFITAHVLSLLGPLSTPLVFAQILNTLQTAPPEDTLSGVSAWAGIWIGLALWFNLAHRTARYFEIDVAFRIKQRFLNRHYGLLISLPMTWHTNHHSGDTIDRVNLAATALGDFAGGQFNYINYFMGFWGPMVALSILSWHLSVITFAMAVVAVTVIVLFDQRLIVLYRTINGINHKISQTLFDYVSNIRTIITLRLGRRTAQEFDQQIARAYAPTMDAEAKVNAAKWFCVSLITNLTQVGAVFYYIWSQLRSPGGILIGNVAAVLQYGVQLTQTFGSIAREYQVVVQNRINFEAAAPILEALGPAVAVPPPPLRDWTTVGLRGLGFGYNDGPTVLKGVDLDIKRGERIALVGASGSGKSTLMATLRGLYPPSSGRLSLDGEAQETLDVLLAITTLMPQEPEIFENTIRFNVQFGIDYPEADVLEAIQLAQFAPVLERLPQGLDTDVRERGVSLSGGERQRLALARGILAARNSTLILMDEPTSSVDAANEFMIYENLFSHFKDTALIASIHRLHLLAHFDRILLMDRGRIIESGPFHTLRDGDGPFSSLWQAYIANTEPSNA